MAAARIAAACSTLASGAGVPSDSAKIYGLGISPHGTQPLSAIARIVGRYARNAAQTGQPKRARLAPIVANTVAAAAAIVRQRPAAISATGNRSAKCGLI